MEYVTVNTPGEHSEQTESDILQNTNKICEQRNAESLTLVSALTDNSVTYKECLNKGHGGTVSVKQLNELPKTFYQSKNRNEDTFVNCEDDRHAAFVCTGLNQSTISSNELSNDIELEGCKHVELLDEDNAAGLFCKDNQFGQLIGVNSQEDMSETLCEIDQMESSTAASPTHTEDQSAPNSQKSCSDKNSKPKLEISSDTCRIRSVSEIPESDGHQPESITALSTVVSNAQKDNENTFSLCCSTTKQDIIVNCESFCHQESDGNLNAISDQCPTSLNEANNNLHINAVNLSQTLPDSELSSSPDNSHTQKIDDGKDKYAMAKDIHEQTESYPVAPVDEWTVHNEMPSTGNKYEFQSEINPQTEMDTRQYNGIILSSHISISENQIAKVSSDKHTVTQNKNFTPQQMVTLDHESYNKESEGNSSVQCLSLYTSEENKVNVKHKTEIPFTGQCGDVTNMDKVRGLEMVEVAPVVDTCSNVVEETDCPRVLSYEHSSDVEVPCGHVPNIVTQKFEFNLKDRQIQTEFQTDLLIKSSVVEERNISKTLLRSPNNSQSITQDSNVTPQTTKSIQLRVIESIQSPLQEDVHKETKLNIEQCQTKLTSSERLNSSQVVSLPCEKDIMCEPNPNVFDETEVEKLQLGCKQVCLGDKAISQEREKTERTTDNWERSQCSQEVSLHCKKETVIHASSDVFDDPEAEISQKIISQEDKAISQESEETESVSKLTNYCERLQYSKDVSLPCEKDRVFQGINDIVDDTELTNLQLSQKIIFQEDKVFSPESEKVNLSRSGEEAENFVPNATSNCESLQSQGSQNIALLCAKGMMYKHIPDVCKDTEVERSILDKRIMSQGDNVISQESAEPVNCVSKATKNCESLECSQNVSLPCEEDMVYEPILYVCVDTEVEESIPSQRTLSQEDKTILQRSEETEATYNWERSQNSQNAALPDGFSDTAVDNAQLFQQPISQENKATSQESVESDDCILKATNNCKNLLQEGKSNTENKQVVDKVGLETLPTMSISQTDMCQIQSNITINPDTTLTDLETLNTSQELSQYTLEESPPTPIVVGLLCEESQDKNESDTNTTTSREDSSAVQIDTFASMSPKAATLCKIKSEICPKQTLYSVSEDAQLLCEEMDGQMMNVLLFDSSGKVSKMAKQIEIDTETSCLIENNPTCLPETCSQNQPEANSDNLCHSNEDKYCVTTCSHLVEDLQEETQISQIQDIPPDFQTELSQAFSEAVNSISHISPPEKCVMRSPELHVDKISFEDNEEKPSKSMQMNPQQMDLCWERGHFIANVEFSVVNKQSSVKGIVPEDTGDSDESIPISNVLNAHYGCTSNNKTDSPESSKTILLNGQSLKDSCLHPNYDQDKCFVEEVFVKIPVDADEQEDEQSTEDKMSNFSPGSSSIIDPKELSPVSLSFSPKSLSPLAESFLSTRSNEEYLYDDISPVPLKKRIIQEENLNAIHDTLVHVDQTVPGNKEDLNAIKPFRCNKDDSTVHTVPEVGIPLKIPSTLFNWQQLGPQQYIIPTLINDDNTDGPSMLPSIPPLNTCSKPLRVGLSRRQRTQPLHSSVSKSCISSVQHKSY